MKLGPVSYEVNVGGQVWRRHAEQLLRQPGRCQPSDPIAVELDEEIQGPTQPEVEAGPATDEAIPMPRHGEDSMAQAPPEDSGEGPAAEAETPATSTATSTAISGTMESPIPAHTSTPATRKTYPRRDRHPLVRYESTF